MDVASFDKELHSYYKRQGISSDSFACRNASSCFSVGVPAYIGSLYASGKIPRLLFLSLDPGHMERYNSRSIEGLRKDTLDWEPKNNEKNRHWYRTHQFTWHVFHSLGYLPSDIGETDDKGDFKPPEDIKKIKPYFAHTNSAKCCQNKAHHSQADSILFSNCQSNVIGEIEEVLQPHILVTQGDMARTVVNEYIVSKGIVCENKRDISSAGKDFDYCELKPNFNKRTVWVHHYHPSCYGRFNKKVYPAYGRYAEEITNFISGYYPKLCFK